MHKIFAKSLFLGKKVVFLPQCHSTNDELVRMVRDSHEPEGTLIYTDEQLNGRGQRGNVWLAESGKNILLSVLLRPKFLSLTHQFYLNLVVGLALVDTLKIYSDGKIQLKWPNDVFLNDKKISGVLIENNLRGSLLESAIVGIGLNVNQQGFGIANATSLMIETGNHFNRDEVIEVLLCNLEKWYLNLKNGSKPLMLDTYHKLLMWRGEIRSFKSKRGEFQGEIMGVDQQGMLVINVEGTACTFGLKEIAFLG